MTTVASFESILDHGAVDPSVRPEVISLQLQTAAALQTSLTKLGGAILGDEVGSGKTFVTFALIARSLLDNPRRGAVILVPSRLLEKKWEQQLQEYLRTAVRDSALGRRLADRVVRLDRSFRVGPHGTFPKRNALVIGSQRLFSFRVSHADQAAVIRAYLTARTDLSYRPWRHFAAACGLPSEAADPGFVGWADPAMLATSPELTAPLKVPFDHYSDGQRDVSNLFGFAIQEVRRRVGRSILPRSSLLVVDEAHNLRNTESQIYKSLMSTLTGKFDGLLFLTGTPFQLGRHELTNIVQLFRNSSLQHSTAAEFDQAIKNMTTSMDRYVDAMDSFGRGWNDLDQAGAERAVQLVNGAAIRPDEATIAATVAAQFNDCLQAKAALEEGLRPFLIRSVRKRHNHERPGLFDKSVVYPESRIPLALVDRLLYEIFREHGRTFIASVSLGACSSWEALMDSAAMSDARPEGKTTRRLLKDFEDRGLLGRHPKVESTVQFCREGVGQQEKALVFVERIKTGQAIKVELAKQLADQDPDDDAKDFLQRRSRLGRVALRENYLHTVFPLAFDSSPDPTLIPDLAERYQALFARSDTGVGTPRDYAIEKRFWDHVYVVEALRRQPKVTGEGFLEETVRRLGDSAYILNGLESGSGEFSGQLTRPSGKRTAEVRQPQPDFAQAYLRYVSPWSSHARDLIGIRLDWRAAFVEAAASSIGRSHLRHEVAALTTDHDAGTTLTELHRLLSDATRGWPARFTRLVEQVTLAAKNPDDRETGKRVGRLLEGFKSNERVQFVGPDSKPETRDRAVAGFNTPLYPDILIATPVLGEGIDLHRSCRRIVHHDLPWNPAKLEQRTGRIDRVGGLVERIREHDPDACIEISLPYMDGTYDKYIFDRVTARRREFRCLLGSLPEWALEEPSDGEPSLPIDDKLVEKLQVDLAPRW